MAVPRYSCCLRDTLKSDSRLEHHAAGKLIDERALNFLPGRLARRVGVAAVFQKRDATLGVFGLRNENVGGAFAEVDAHAVAGPEQRKPAASRRLRRGIENRRRA